MAPTIKRAVTYQGLWLVSISVRTVNSIFLITIINSLSSDAQFLLRMRERVREMFGIEGRIKSVLAKSQAITLPLDILLNI